jgi:hypothetical protein
VRRDRVFGTRDDLGDSKTRPAEISQAILAQPHRRVARRLFRERPPLGTELVSTLGQVVFGKRFFFSFRISRRTKAVIAGWFVDSSAGIGSWGSSPEN